MYVYIYIYIHLLYKSVKICNMHVTNNGIR